MISHPKRRVFAMQRERICVASERVTCNPTCSFSDEERPQSRNGVQQFRIDKSEIHLNAIRKRARGPAPYSRTYNSIRPGSVIATERCTTPSTLGANLNGWKERQTSWGHWQHKLESISVRSVLVKMDIRREIVIQVQDLGSSRRSPLSKRHRH
jgi:hypothetical protein